jgi:hypothetical protein
MTEITDVMRITRRGSALALLWLASLVLLAEPGHAGREVTLRWLPSGGAAVQGYRVYLGDQPGTYQGPIDLGPRYPNPSTGVVTAVIPASAVQLPSDATYYASMTAYNSAGESGLSNEILVPVPVCTASSCDDGNPCTVDSCEASGCSNSPTSGNSCNDGDPSTISDVCQAGVCQGSSVQCSSDSQCADSDACNGTERCISNSCVSGSPLFCPAPSQCTVGICQAGACGSTPVVNGLSCNDGNSSTSNDTCQSGVCVGSVTSPPGSDPGPDPGPPPPDLDPLRSMLLEALGTMTLVSVAPDSSGAGQAAFIPPGATPVPLDPGLRIFDPVASVSGCEPEFCLWSDLDTDARGRVRGAGAIQIGSETLVTAFSGKLKGKNGLTQVRLRIKLKGTVQGVPMKGSSNLRGHVDWSTGLFNYECSTKACVAGSGCEQLTLSDSVALSPSQGLWTLHMDVSENDGSSLRGSAVATLGDGRAVYYDLKGKHNAKRDRWSLTLKGVGDDPGSSVKLKDVVLSGEKVESGRIAHKILGHRGFFELAP